MASGYKFVVCCDVLGENTCHILLSIKLLMIILVEMCERESLSFLAYGSEDLTANGFLGHFYAYPMAFFVVLDTFFVVWKYS